MPVQYPNDLLLQRQRLFRGPAMGSGGGLRLYSEGSGPDVTFILELPLARTLGVQKSA